MGSLEHEATNSCPSNEKARKAVQTEVFHAGVAGLVAGAAPEPGDQQDGCTQQGGHQEDEGGVGVLVDSHGHCYGAHHVQHRSYLVRKTSHGQESDPHTEDISQDITEVEDSCVEYTDTVHILGTGMVQAARHQVGEIHNRL